MALKKQFKEIDCSLLDAVELRDKLDDVISEILSKNSKTEIKVTTDKITLYYYVKDE